VALFSRLYRSLYARASSHASMLMANWSINRLVPAYVQDALIRGCIPVQREVVDIPVGEQLVDARAE
jgi:hypothetical protein